MAIRSRLINIDMVRGIAAVAVMVQHSLETGGIERLGQPGFGFVWFNLGETGVVAFFLVSGFVIPLSLERWRNVGRFAASRILRIYPLYIFALLLAAALNGLPTGRSLLAHLFLVQEYAGVPQMVGAAWTLSLEAAWYCVFTALYILALNRRTGLITLMAVSALLLGSALPLLGGPSLPMARFGMLATCMVGLLAYRAYDGERPGVTAWCIAAIIGAIIVGLYSRLSLFPGHNPVAPSFTCGILSWSLAYFLFFISFFAKPSPILARMLGFVGMISYSVYLLHGFALELLPNAGLHGWPFVVAVPLVVIPTAYVSYRFVELPFIRLSHRYPWRIQQRNAG